jgi:hypothetical protein
MTALQQFFNSFLKNKDIMVSQEHNVLTYFNNHAQDDQSRKAIDQFKQFRENKNAQQQIKKLQAPTTAVDMSKPVQMVIGGGANGAANTEQK